MNIMYRISPECYCKLFELLLEEFDRKEYYSGSFEFDFKGVRFRMVLSAFIYRRLEKRPEGEFSRVCDVVPVWWELHTEYEGEELLNDFSFNELRAYIREQ